MSISDWAKQHGVPPALVYSVLAGKTQCTRGRSHQVAVLLGLKAPPNSTGVKNLVSGNPSSVDPIGSGS